MTLLSRFKDTTTAMSTTVIDWTEVCILFRAQLPQNSKFKFESSLKAATTVRKRISPITSAQSFCLKQGKLKNENGF